jgi:hypothetical protein
LEEEEESKFVLVNQIRNLQRIVEIEESELVQATPRKLAVMPIGIKMSREARFGPTQAGPLTKRKRSRLNLCGNCERKIEFHERNCIAVCGHRFHLKCTPVERFNRTAPQCSLC